MNFRSFCTLFIILLTGTLSLQASWLDSDTNTEGVSPYEVFRSKAREHNIATKTISAGPNLSSGYYLVAGVFGVSENANSFAKKLRQRHSSAEVFRSPENGMHYVYLERKESGNGAIDAYLKSQYTKKMWILHVAGNETQISNNASAEKQTPAEVRISHNAFLEAAKKSKVATRTVDGLKNFRNGYYAIAGVFGDPNNVKRFVNEMSNKGVAPQSVTHPETGLSYVYLSYSADWKPVLDEVNAHFGGKYNGKTWIMHVDGGISTPLKTTMERIEGTVPEAGNQKARAKAYAFAKTSKDPPSKLLQKADAYFDKMWYAQAAELYEEYLSGSQDNYSYEILQKAGDSHYFNSNMERAFYWYDLLYNRYTNEISSENIFKYAHSLKGTGKYAKAKRLMRIYDRRVKKEGMRYTTDDPRTTPKEKVLDNILNTEQEYTLRNIGTNSEYSDFSPMFYNGDQLVFASAMDSSFFSTRRYKWNNQPYLDLYVAKMNEESQEVKDAVKFSKKINTKYHEASVTFSPDNTTMYFTRNNYGKKLKRDKNGVNNLKIYRSQKVNGEWTEARELPFNSDDYSTGHPALSPDGKKLYFVSDRPGSLGETDIFVVDVHDDGSYSEPRNLGPEINTERKEMFPFVTDKKLYFSSNGHIGLGGLDIYEVAYDEAGFHEVKNMGKPINGKTDDFSYIVNEDTQKGFFASNRRGGKGDDDIYSFSRILPEELNLNAIEGVITDLVTGEVMPQALVTLLDENNIKLKEVVSDEDGSFVFEDLDGNTKYTVKTSMEGYSDVVLNVTTKENEVIPVEVNLQKLEDLIVLEEGIKKIKLNMIFFDFDKSNIRQDAADELAKLIAIMKANPSMVIKIESHTDSRGPAVYNKYLSDRRAKSTRDYIISQGIDPRRIQSATGYGEERLLNGCDGSVRCSSAQHQLNRRSEFIIVDM